ncbi:terminase large subunit domain-containing protein [Rhizobium johnstonii]|uniref:terminase large subunit domain-containing protein n=1 Tax=Rhizobium johnstonii TaxID=3019933 RepID=UPI003F9D0E7E
MSLRVNPTELDTSQLVTEEDWARHRRAMLMGLPAELDGKALPDVLLEHQKQLLQATAAYRLVVTDKSRRVGATWGVGADAVLTAGLARNEGGMDVLYLGYNLDMAREFIDTCGMWARAFMPACSEVQEFLFIEQGEKGADHAIKAFRITFASGFEICALSSKPRSLRGRQGFVIFDEYAFHDDPAELLKAAMALLIWGGKVLVISTHNGADNPFNELIQEIRAGKRPGAVVRVTFDDALEYGLYQRVCMKTGQTWSAEGEAKWRAEIYKSYGSGADEELRCIPSQGSGAYLSRTLIHARMREDIPVIRWKAPAGFVDWPEGLRKAEIEDFCNEQLKPLLEELDPRCRSCFGQDFGRSGDLSVIHPLQVRQNLSLSTPFLLELRDVPFESQKQIAIFIKENMPRFFHAAFDASGNGAYLAEACRQAFGSSLVSEIKLSTSWYLLNMPKLKAAFEDGTFELPLDDDVMNDYRAIVMTKGIAKIPDDARSEGADGFPRHGDSAIAGALAVFASVQSGGQVGASTADTRPNTEILSDFIGGQETIEQRTDFSDFLRM